MKRALVTGAGGFIGNALTKYLKDKGYWVRGVDVKYPEWGESAADEFLRLDLRRADRVFRAYGTLGFDEVYALAAADGRALLWTLPTSFTPADITGATVSFKVKHPDGTLTKTGGIVSATTPIQVKVELAAADTTGLDDGDYPFTLRVALAVSGRTITITRAGIFKVRSGL